MASKATTSDMITTGNKRKRDELDAIHNQSQKLLTSYFKKPDSITEVFGVSCKQVFQQLPTDSTLSLAQVRAELIVIIIL